MRRRFGAGRRSTGSEHKRRQALKVGGAQTGGLPGPDNSWAATRLRQLWSKNRSAAARMCASRLETAEWLA
jgi:hypothetical protein